MATLLVSDTSVLVDLDRGGILNALFQLPFDIGVPDVLYDLELKDWEGPNLVAAGLKVLALDGDGVALAQRYRGQEIQVVVVTVAGRVHRVCSNPRATSISTHGVHLAQPESGGPPSSRF